MSGVSTIPQLYLIEILHQTTTLHIFHKGPEMLYLIEILHQTTTLPALTRIDPVLYLIEILHQTTTAHKDLWDDFSCILSKFYIKPQLRLSRKPMLAVVSYRNSTSNHNSFATITLTVSVVSYRNSTSNHNSD